MTIDLQQCRDNFCRRAAAQQAAHESLRLQAREEAIVAILEAVPTCPGITQIYLFGSVTKIGQFRPHSDIDVAVAGTDAETYFSLWRKLESACPGWPIDLREINQPGYFTDSVRRAGELIYESPSCPPQGEH